VYVWDLQNKCVKVCKCVCMYVCMYTASCSIQASYNGHQDYIHAVCLRPGSNQLLSASEDGSLCIWGMACCNILSLV